MRLKEGTKMELQREICKICPICPICQMLTKQSGTVRDPYLNFSSDSMPFSRDFRDLKKTPDGRTDGLIDQRRDGRTDPLIEMRGRILELSLQEKVNLTISDANFEISKIWI